MVAGVVGVASSGGGDKVSEALLSADNKFFVLDIINEHSSSHLLRKTYSEIRPSLSGRW